MIKVINNNIQRHTRHAFSLILSAVVLFCPACDRDTPETNHTPEISQAYGVDFNSTWGDLIQVNGGKLPWDTLTEYQQSLVHYPKFDSSCVYWVDGGYAYHSVDWCYTLSKSSNIRHGTLEEAKAARKTDPCSKCVGN
ncbi:hypothetical protein [Dehalogenimonas alkenigignens]|uniref:hypothetical protein n=1 Tax=Dehalogenimonas alkenigignens TaxID=1217799 RepID=UPI001187528C|nr:hypothetical protein [Dehalogenimonas alkenigignens]